MTILTYAPAAATRPPLPQRPVPHEKTPDRPTPSDPRPHPQTVRTTAQPQAGIVDDIEREDDQKGYEPDDATHVPRSWLYGS
ncbi:hypothetical protein ABZV34_23935 [Streptomyces sp. NPDC005195]|uniref:hypothetical protein n=1 Tax=Streptomyces sp. NPDC005195 TaxID=3154561 RepID=UPI0033AEB6FC